MFSLTIFVGNGMWALLFKTKESAQLAFDATQGKMGNTLLLNDDFGHQMFLEQKSVHGAVLENLDESKLAHCERALHQQRTQIQAQRMSESDVTIKTARQMSGPALIQPMGPNGGFRA